MSERIELRSKYFRGVVSTERIIGQFAQQINKPELFPGFFFLSNDIKGQFGDIARNDHNVQIGIGWGQLVIVATMHGCSSYYLSYNGSSVPNKPAQLL